MKSARTWVLRTAACAAAIALFAQAASAQQCNGTPGFNAGKIQLHAGFTSQEGTTLGAGLTYGGSSPIYFGGQVSQYSDEGYSLTGFGAHGGYIMQPASMPKVQWCPQAYVDINSGSVDGDDEYDESGNVIKIGTTAGFKASESSSMVVNLFGGAHFARYSWSYDVPFFGDVSGSASGIELNLGAGFVFNNKIAVRPIITISTVEHHDTAFGVWGTIALGGGTSAIRAR